MIKLAQLLLIFVFCLGSSYGQAAPTTKLGGEKEAKSGKYKFFKGQKTKIKRPFEMRDPFKRKRLRKKRTTRFGNFSQSGIFSNLPSIDGVPLDQIKIVGILLGKNRRAIAKIGDSSSGAAVGGSAEAAAASRKAKRKAGGSSGDATYILKEGMKIGENEAEIKAILPGGIVLVEKITNVYDQDEYLETIIPLTSE
ncbi:MAG: hypothetical protein HN509_07655 [Halobacteriovoraceae bacterium]|jgi:hypothetical protein|nr:hypothetical protein [Halobacteriovoraceae bacterium]